MAGAHGELDAAMNGRQAAKEAIMGSLGEAGPGGKPRILVIHCDFNLSQMIQEVLAMEGYQTEIAVMGEGALSILQEAPEGMIVFAEVLAWRLEGNEDLCAYMEDAERRARHATFLLGGWNRIEEFAGEKGFLGALELPFEVDDLFDLVDEGERALRAKAGPVPPGMTIDY